MAIILVISCHYDDAEIGCCETIRQHISNGDKVIYAVTNSDEDRTGNITIRLSEQVNAMIDIGLDPKLSLLTFDSTDPMESIINKLDYYKPNIVFTPWIHDTHQDHRRASSIGQSIGRKRHITTYFYSSGSSFEFNPNIFNAINFGLKERVLKYFDSQIRCDALNIDIIKKRELYWGSLISNQQDIFAEAFMARKVKYAL